MISSAADTVRAIEGVPPWLMYVGLVVIGPLVGVLVAWLRRLLKVPEDGMPTGRHQVANPPATPSSGVATVAEPAASRMDLLEGFVVRLQESHDKLVATNAQMGARHEQEMAELQARHAGEVAAFEAQLQAQRETIDELRATLRALTNPHRPSTG